jgi:hypothetical protein
VTNAQSEGSEVSFHEANAFPSDLEISDAEDVVLSRRERQWQKSRFKASGTQMV